MIRPPLSVTLLSLLLGLATPRLSAAPDRVLFDFESGTFAGWKLEGLPAFGTAPVNPDRDMQAQHAPTARYRFTGWQGAFMVSQDIMLSQRRGIRETQVPGGRLISEPFVIDRDYLKFRLGGLLHPGVYVALVLEDSTKPVQEGETFVLAEQAFANNKFDLVERGWNVQALRGQTARLHLVVQAAHRTLFRADHFVLSDTPPPADGLYARTHWLDCTVMAPGKFHLMFPAIEEGPAFCNASVVRGHDGRWHLFAEESKNNNGYFGNMNNLVYHASADGLRERWTPLTPVLCRAAPQGEAWLRNPVVVYDESARQYVMAYWGTGAGRDKGPFGVCLATSPDGVNWTRDTRNPVFTHDFTPLLGCIVRDGGHWVLFYSNHGDEAVHVDHAVIYYRTSANLHEWSEAKELAVTSAKGQTVGYNSRPVFFKRGAEWFMLANNRTSQQGRARFLFTQVYSGPDLFHWDIDQQYRGNLNLFSGPQIFLDEKGEWQAVYWHVTSGGPWITRMRFDDSAPRVSMPTEWPGIPVAK